MAVHVCGVASPEIPVTRGADAGVGYVIRYVMNSIAGTIAVARNAVNPVMRIINSYTDSYIRKKTYLKNHGAKEHAKSAEK